MHDGKHVNPTLDGVETWQPCQNLRLVFKGTGELEFELPMNSCSHKIIQITKCSQSTLLPPGVLPYLSYIGICGICMYVFIYFIK